MATRKKKPDAPAGEPGATTDASTTTTERAPRSRIIGLRTVPLSRIDRFGFGNPNKMTPEQRKTLNHSLGELGTIVPLIGRVSKKDPERVELLDGHHRFDDFEERGDPAADVLIVDAASDDVARAVLLALRQQGSFDREELDTYLGKWVEEGTVKVDWLSNVTGLGPSDSSLFDLKGTGFLDDFLGGEGGDGEASGGGGDAEGGQGEGGDDEEPTTGLLTYSVGLTPADHEKVLDTIALAKKHEGARNGAAALVAICRAYRDTVK